jgi:hypothetical protein
MQDLIGRFVISKAGRDAGKCYVIINTHNEYVYLVDGIIRTLDNPKKKNIKHIIKLKYTDNELAEAIKNDSVRNEDIKRALKILRSKLLKKEVE